MDTSNLQKSDRAMWRCCSVLKPHVPGGRGVVRAFGPEAGGIHTESIFLISSFSFMRLDLAAGVICTNGDDKF